MSSVGHILAGGIVLFVLVASGALIVSGLANGRSATSRAAQSRWRSRLQLAIGILGFAVSAWIGLGMITHAW